MRVPQPCYLFYLKKDSQLSVAETQVLPDMLGSVLQSRGLGAPGSQGLQLGFKGLGFIGSIGHRVSAIRL